MTNQRHPRTMQEAFGPYTDSKLQPMKADPDSLVGWAIIGLAVVSVGLGFVFGF